MLKRIILNVVLVLVGYCIPYYLLGVYQKDLAKMEARQVPLLGAIFVTSFIITFFNYKNLKQKISQKWIWIIFLIVGIIGLLYSGGILWLLFEFRHGIGF